VLRAIEGEEMAWLSTQGGAAKLFLNEESNRMALVELRAVKIGEASWLSSHGGAEKLF
jgi:hypothetical protein